MSKYPFIESYIQRGMSSYVNDLRKEADRQLNIMAYYQEKDWRRRAVITPTDIDNLVENWLATHKERFAADMALISK